MESQDTVRLLAGMLKHPDESIWTSAAWGLAGEEGTAAIPALVEALAREQREYYGVHHHAAVVALAKIGEPAVEALIGALQSRQVVVRQRAAEALAQMPGTTKTLVALIKAAAENDDKSVRGQAKLVLQWLPGLDKDDTVVLPALACIVQDKSPKVRKEAAHLLSDITWPEGVLPQPLLDLVGDSDSSVRVAAVETLFSRRLDKRVIPALERLLDHPDKSVRGRINELLERVRK
jgi:HEAT repeat protein